MPMSTSLDSLTGLSSPRPMRTDTSLTSLCLMSSGERWQKDEQDDTT